MDAADPRQLTRRGDKLFREDVQIKRIYNRVVFDELERFVLKPLFSFAGGGVNVEPKPEDLSRIPEAEQDKWCIQEKIEYAPALKTPDGSGVKIEIRMMFLRPDDEREPILAPKPSPPFARQDARR